MQHRYREPLRARRPPAPPGRHLRLAGQRRVVVLRGSWGELVQFPIPRAEVHQRRIAAGWVLSMAGAPIERGAVLIGAHGRIQSVGPDDVVPRPPGVPTSEFPDAALLPGLINTHTHLELTGFEGLVTEPEFPSWIRSLRQLKTTRTPDEYVQAARRGLADCYAAGVTTIADTGDSGAVIKVLAEAGGSGIAYQEVFGPHPAQAKESLAGLERRVQELSHLTSSRVRIGVSPHAPYTVSAALFSSVAAWAKAERLPLAVHAAESREETEFLVAGAGPFAQAWKERNIPLPDSLGLSPVAWLSNHEVLSPLTLCIHAVQLGQADIRVLAESGAAVAHCPLSNSAHRHGTAPVAAMIAAGVRVGLGTDSVVSIGRLDLLAEARLAGEQAGLSAGQQLELCTIRGARALNLEAEVGSLEPGKWADCIVIRLASRGETPAERLVASSQADVVRTYVGGKEVYRSE
jgi:cytosine/adenosine deaminase-related metal-dependent hydrolase